MTPTALTRTTWPPCSRAAPTGRHRRTTPTALAEIAARFSAVNWQAAWDAAPGEIQWLIEPLIEAGQSVALYAVPGTGKSLIALECAAALAAGRPVLGNPARDPVTVVYIDVENRQPSLVERLQAFGYQPADLDRLILYSFPSIAALDTPAGGQQILALAVTAHAAIVIIDTTSRVVAGPENDADTYLAFYRHTVVPLRARGCAAAGLDIPALAAPMGSPPNHPSVRLPAGPMRPPAPAAATSTPPAGRRRPATASPAGPASPPPAATGPRPGACPPTDVSAG